MIVEPIRQKGVLSKQYLQMFDYWHKKGAIGYIPYFVLYKSIPKGELYVMREGQTVYGIAYIIDRKKPYEFFQIKTIAIHRDHLGKGLGDKFMKELLRLKQKQNANLSFVVEVLPNNRPAINLYKKHGFRVTEKFVHNGVPLLRLVKGLTSKKRHTGAKKRTGDKKTSSGKKSSKVKKRTRIKRM